MKRFLPLAFVLLSATQAAAQNPFSLINFGATAVDTNSGSKSAGTLRVVIATDQPALTNALKVDGSATTQPVSGTFWQATQPVSIASLPSGAVTNAGTFATQATQAGTWTVQPGNTANTTAWLVAGGKTHNNAAPGATNVGALIGIANASVPTYTEGDQVLASLDLSGRTRVIADINNGSTTVTEAATITAGQSNVALTSAVLFGFDGTTDSRLRTRAAIIGSSDVGLVTRPFLASDGTNTQPAMDAAARPGFQKITDGTNTLPTMDVAARAGFHKLTDGTNTVIVDPCQGQTPVYLPFSQAASAQLIAGTSAKKIYLCSWTLVAAAAENVSLVEGTGTVCATGIAAVIGATTAANGLNLAANGGLTFGNGAASVAAEATNADNLCLLQAGSVRVAGVLKYVVQ